MDKHRNIFESSDRPLGQKLFKQLPKQGIFSQNSHGNQFKVNELHQKTKFPVFHHDLDRYLRVL